VVRPGVVEERAGVANLPLEAELIGDVLARVAVVVDVDLIQNVGVEVVVVRSLPRLLIGDVVGDDGDGVGGVGAAESVEVGIVGDRIEPDQRSLAVR
jgi:hypothetical protein